jgi:hypothetical protein
MNRINARLNSKQLLYVEINTLQRIALHLESISESLKKIADRSAPQVGVDTLVMDEYVKKVLSRDQRIPDRIPRTMPDTRAPKPKRGTKRPRW